MIIKLYKIRKFIFAGIPILLLILNFLFLKDIGMHFMSCFDPNYAYLFNGLNLARGVFEIGHTDHPGTPLQIIYAIIIRITFLFNNKHDLAESVLSSPESYLLPIFYVIIFINVVVVYLLGFYSYKHSESIRTAIFMQLTSLVSLQSVFSISMIACESLLFPLSILLVILSFNYTFSQKPVKINLYVFGFSILTALLITVKISSFPLIIVPIILLKSFRKKLIFILLTIIFAFIFLIPAIDKLSHFFEFVSGMATHLGKYGKGPMGMIDFMEYLGNIIRILKVEFPFTFSYFLVMTVSALILIKYKKLSETEPKIKKLLLAIFLAMSFQIILVARQYSFHYLIPSYTFSILGIYTIFIILKPELKIVERLKLSWINNGLICIILMLFVRLFIQYHFYPKMKNPTIQTIQFLQKYNNKPHIILADRYKESAFIEQALYFGVSYSGAIVPFYKKYLKKLYPKSYFYSIDEDILNWEKSVMKEELMSEFPEIIIYEKYNNSEQKRSLINHFLNIQVPDTLYSISKLYESTNTHEIIYQLINDTASIKKIIKPKLTISSNLEILNKYSTKFTDNSEIYLFDKSYLRNTFKHHSGNYSIKLDSANPYGLDTKIDVKAGNYVQIQVWRYPCQSDGLIACNSSGPAQLFKCGAASIKQTKDGWELVELSFYIPESFTDDQINIFMWNNGTKDIYFDDIEIKIFK